MSSPEALGGLSRERACATSPSMRSSPAKPKLSRLASLPFVAACVAIYAVSDMPRPPVPDVMAFDFSDKLMHAAAYGLLGWLAALSVVARKGMSRRSLREAWVWATAYGCFDEWHQSFVPHRSASVGDIAADAFGAALALWLLWRVRKSTRVDFASPR